MQVHRFHFENLLAAEGQKLLGDGGGFFRGALNLVQVKPSRGLRGQGAVEKVRAAVENHEHIVEVVRDAARETPQHLHFLRLAHLRFQLCLLFRPLLQFEFDSFPFADILNDEHE